MGSNRISEGRQNTLRQSNIELLRIFAMLIIVAHHFSVHGGFEFSTDSITMNRLWIQFIQIGGKIGADIFILISGYFLVTTSGIKTSKVLKLWLHIFIYSVIIFAIFVAVGIEPFGIKELIKHLLPVLSSRWWFASAYFVLYLLAPYINKLLKSLDKSGYQRMLILLTICWCIIPTFTSWTFQSNALIWFIYLYALAGYIRLHGIKIKTAGTRYILLAIVVMAITYLSAVVLDILGIRISFFGLHATFFYDMQRLPIVLISVLMFVGFTKINIGYRITINIISSAMFGVYLLHDDGYVRPFLWGTIFKNASYSDSAALIPYSIIVIMIVFIICMLIELARIYFLEKNYMKLVDKLSGYIDKKKEQFFSMKIFTKI